MTSNGRVIGMCGQQRWSWSRSAGVDPGGVCILGWSRSQYFKFEPEPEATIKSVQEPIKIF